MMNLNLKFYTVVRKAMKYIHYFFENLLRLLLVGLHGQTGLHLICCL
jgi:hypothetical protein